MFHHGLIKLIVLHELKRVKKDGSSFWFVCDFVIEEQGEGSSSWVKETSSAEVSRYAMTRAKRFAKLKPRNQVKEEARKTSTAKSLAAILKTPKSAKRKISELKGETLE